MVTWLSGTARLIEKIRRRTPEGTSAGAIQQGVAMTDLQSRGVRIRRAKRLSSEQHSIRLDVLGVDHRQSGDS